MRTKSILAVLAVMVLTALGGAWLGWTQGHRAAGLTPMDGPAPDFTLRDTGGATVRLADLRGKAVIVNFWATWCPPCRAEMPSLERAWTRLKDNGGQVLAIHVGGTADEVRDFLAREALDLPVAIDGDSRVIRQWPVQGLPTTFIVAPDGRVAFRAIGGRDWDSPEILEEIRRLTKGKAPT